MSQPAPTPKDEAVASEKLRQMELAISLILRGGVLLSAVIIGAGAVLFLLTGKSGYQSDLSVGQGVSAFTNYQGEQKANLYFPTNPGAILAGALAFKSFGLIALGLLVLILTPVLRVVVSVFTFGLERDWLYVLFTIFVLGVLLASFFLGKAGG